MTEFLLTKKSYTGLPVFVEEDGYLWYPGGYAAQWGYDVGMDTTKVVIEENDGGAEKIKISRSVTEMGRTVEADTVDTVVIENGELRFSNFTLLGGVLHNMFFNG